MREFDRLFVDFFGTPLVDDSREPRTWYLPLDVVDRGNAYQVKAALPGFKPEDVEVTFADGALAIKAQRKQESESKDGSYLRRELTYGDYERRVQLPGDVKEADIKAAFDNGMLTIEIPKVPAPQPVKIPVAGKSEKQLVGANSEKR
jgi:HSP20 family protein